MNPIIDELEKSYLREIFPKLILAILLKFSLELLKETKKEFRLSKELLLKNTVQALIKLLPLEKYSRALVLNVYSCWTLRELIKLRFSEKVM